METQVKKKEALEKIASRWDGRDRLVVVCVADYTDLALGLGETRLGLSVFSCSSASVSHAHERATRMGHEAGALVVGGDAGEDFKRLLGMVGRAWSRTSSWSYRYLELDSLVEGDVEVGVIFAQGDLGRSKPDVRKDCEALRRLIGMYGVESSDATPILLATHETSTLTVPSRHPMLWSWVCAAVGLGIEPK